MEKWERMFYSPSSSSIIGRSRSEEHNGNGQFSAYAPILNGKFFTIMMSCSVSLPKTVNNDDILPRARRVWLSPTNTCSGQSRYHLGVDPFYNGLLMMNSRDSLLLHRNLSAHRNGVVSVGTEWMMPSRKASYCHQLGSNCRHKCNCVWIVHYNNGTIHTKEEENARDCAHLVGVRYLCEGRQVVGRE